MWIKTHRYLVCMEDPQLTTAPPQTKQHTNQDKTRRQSKDKDSTINKTEHQSIRNPTGKPRRARQTAKAPGPHKPINIHASKPEPSQSRKSDPPACNQRGKQSLQSRLGPTTKQAVNYSSIGQHFLKNFLNGGDNTYAQRLYIYIC